MCSVNELQDKSSKKGSKAFYIQVVIQQKQDMERTSSISIDKHKNCNKDVPRRVNHPSAEYQRGNKQDIVTIEHGSEYILTACHLNHNSEAQFRNSFRHVRDHELNDAHLARRQRSASFTACSPHRLMGLIAGSIWGPEAQR